MNNFPTKKDIYNMYILMDFLKCYFEIFFIDMQYLPAISRFWMSYDLTIFKMGIFRFEPKIG